MIEYTSQGTGFELTTLVAIGTDCICSCNHNYHTITTTTAPPRDDWRTSERRVKMVNTMHENNPVTVSSWDHEAVLFFKTQRCPFWPNSEWQKLFHLFSPKRLHMNSSDLSPVSSFCRSVNCNFSERFEIKDGHHVLWLTEIF